MYWKYNKFFINFAQIRCDATNLHVHKNLRFKKTLKYHKEPVI